MSWMHLLPDHFDMPSGDRKPSRATKVWRARQRELAATGQIRICLHCGHTLHVDETDICRLCAVDVSEEKD